AVERAPDSHKGDNGYVAVVGGGPYTGAPTLSALASLRAGGDLARVVAPTEAAGVARQREDLLVTALEGDRLSPDTADAALDAALDADVAVVGPGIGDDAGSVDAAGAVVDAVDRCVVDAEAQAALPEVDTDPDEVVATPHAGELSRHLGRDAGDGLESRVEAAEAAAREHDVTVLLKGVVDVVSDGRETRLSDTGNEGMTVGGTGDVLAGVCGRMLSQVDGFEAACVAAYVNGAAGDLTRDDLGFGLLASDVVDRLPMVAEEIWR
ncbi:MAG: NAD(P)H-hydrate dehydratase, partial [Halobacteriales archaeon]